jgi:hypothetical protein
MPSIQITIGPFAAIYVGDYGSDSVLTQVTSIGTGPAQIVDTIPETYEDVVDASLQSGRRTVTCSFKFLDEVADDMIIGLSRRAYSSRE